MYGMPPGHVFMTGLNTLVLLWLLVGLFIAGLVLAFSAKLVGIENASVIGAIVAIIGGAVLGGIVAGVVAVLFAWMTPANMPLAWLAFLITYVWVIKAVFHTSWIKAFIAWIIAMVIEVIIAFLLSAIGLVVLHPMI
ncbi:hypothetical protein [Thermococcus sp.]|uniref:hypothetical protein n=1 Tax=Thermococcus sp. TaxID=35749 RepID=UPI0026070316|nr:hypothetical protein [Thermococcus sp.]